MDNKKEEKRHLTSKSPPKNSDYSSRNYESGLDKIKRVLFTKENKSGASNKNDQTKNNVKYTKM